MSDLGSFICLSGLFQAKRHQRSFVCLVDGMTLRGMPMDWEVVRADGASFPLPDHLFRIIFLPTDELGQKLYKQTFSITASMSEGITVSDAVQVLKSKFTK